MLSCARYMEWILQGVTRGKNATWQSRSIDTVRIDLNIHSVSREREPLLP